MNCEKMYQNNNLMSKEKQCLLVLKTFPKQGKPKDMIIQRWQNGFMGKVIRDISAWFLIYGRTLIDGRERIMRLSHTAPYENAFGI